MTEFDTDVWYLLLSYAEKQNKKKKNKKYFLPQYQLEILVKSIYLDIHYKNVSFEDCLNEGKNIFDDKYILISTF